MKLHFYLVICIFSCCFGLMAQSEISYEDITDRIKVEEETGRLIFSLDDFQGSYNSGCENCEILCAGIAGTSITIILQPKDSQPLFYTLNKYYNKIHSDWNGYLYEDYNYSVIENLEDIEYLELIDINTLLTKYKLKNGQEFSSIHRFTKNGMKVYSREKSEFDDTIILRSGLLHQNLNERPEY